jgi:hypothetical protein
MIIGGFAAGVRILLEKGPSRHHISKDQEILEKYQKIIFYQKADDEGMTNRPSIFAYLVFGPGGITVERIKRPTKIAAWRGLEVKLGVQADIRRVRAGLVFD